jgi:hypothetical protein
LQPRCGQLRLGLFGDHGFPGRCAARQGWSTKLPDILTADFAIAYEMIAAPTVIANAHATIQTRIDRIAVGVSPPVNVAK